MSPRTQLAYYVLWLAHPTLQAAVAGVMFWRKLHRKFPIFFSYIISQIVIFSVVFPVYRSGNYAWFFYVYWVGTAIGVVLGFKVIHEIFLDVFRPYHTLKDLGTVLFKWAGLVMLLVAIVVAASSPSAQGWPLIQATLTTQRCVRVIQLGLVLFLLVFSRYLGVSKRQDSFGIALGFGGFAGIELACVALFTGNYLSEVALNLVNMATYNCAIVVWLTYVLIKSPARENAANLLRPQRWEQSLVEIQHPDSADSLIPMFEGMVDSALSRTKGTTFSLQTKMPASPVASPAASAGTMTSADVNCSAFFPQGSLSK